MWTPSPFLGRAYGRTLFPSQDSGQGTGEVPPNIQVQDDSNRTDVAQTVVVHKSPRAKRRGSRSSAKHGKVADSTSIKSVSSKSTDSESPRLAAAKRKLLKQGFSEESANRISAPQAVSSRKLYDAKWRIFVTWCKDNKVSWRHPSVAQIADFLVHLFQNKKCSVRTIQGYKAAIASTLRFSHEGLSHDPRLRSLICSFRKERPIVHNPFPAWDLSLVLHALMKEPFEPLTDCDLKLLTLKTVFLVLLASGARRVRSMLWMFSQLLIHPTGIE